MNAPLRCWSTPTTRRESVPPSTARYRCRWTSGASAMRPISRSWCAMISATGPRVSSGCLRSRPVAQTLRRGLRRCAHPPDIGRHRFLGKRLERCVQRRDLLVFLAQPPDRDRTVGSFLFADNEQDGDLGEGVLSHLVVYLLVAEVAFGAQPMFSCRFDRLARKAVRV